MSIKLTYKNGNVKQYDPRLPIETQLKDIKCVSMCWKKDGGNINLFLTDLSRALEFKMIEPFEFEVDHGNDVRGAQVKKKSRQLKDKMAFAWLVKEVVNFQSHVDKSLENLSMDMRASTVK